MGKGGFLSEVAIRFQNEVEPLSTAVHHVTPARTKILFSHAMAARPGG